MVITLGNAGDVKEQHGMSTWDVKEQHVTPDPLNITGLEPFCKSVSLV